jgi:enoyl-CoA hydratase/carnithine racemase
MTTWSLEQHGKVGVLTFTRPPRNLMDMASMTELVGHLESLSERTDEVTVVMLTGGVDGYFIAHADLDDLAKIARGEMPDGDPRSWSQAMHLLENMPQPTVAAIDGQAWGGGSETSLACTMRIGSERAHMGQPEVAIGIIPGGGGTQRLPRLVGSAIGAELCLSGRVIDAAEAKRIGLLNEVLPTDGFVEHAIAWCERIARHPAHAVFAAKKAVVDGLRLPLDQGLRLEVELFLTANASDDAKARNAAVSRPGEARVIGQ